MTDSEYLNVTLESTEPLNVTLESVPQMVVMYLEAAEGAASTQITLGGFTPLTTYYKYEDDYHNKVIMTTDSNGSYTYTQDLLCSHLVFIQPNPSTKFINATDGGDCISIGTWEPSTLTCTLTQDVLETIQIDSNGLTLDGAGYMVSGLRTGYGIYLFNRTGVTVKNLDVEGFSYGIYLYSSSSNTLEGNTASNNNYGIDLYSSSNNEIYNNNFVGNMLQAYVEYSSGNVFNLPWPIGGNYWSDWTSPDSDGDYFVDFPYLFTSGQDDLPWVVQDGWGTPIGKVHQLENQVLTLNLQHGIENSLDAKLEAVQQALDDLNENNDVAAINAMEAFKNAVEAQRGKEIAEEDADALISSAQAIIAAIERQ